MSADAHPLLAGTVNQGLRGMAVRGALTTGLTQIAKILIQFLSTIVLTRLLLPSDFGIIAMIAPLIGFSVLIQNFGLTEAIVTAPILKHAEAATIFYLNLGLSVLFAGLTAAMAPLVAAFYHEPRLIPFTMVMAVQIAIAGATSAHQALLSRGMRFNQIAIIEVVRAAFGVLCAIAVAWAYHTPWALVVQQLSGAGVALIMTWYMTRWQPSGPAPLSAVRSILHFGVGMTSFNLTNFLSRNADNVMIGWAWGAVQLGLYDRAYKLLLFPLQQVNNPISRVMVPILSRLNDEPERYVNAYRRTLQITMLATVPGMLTLVLTAPVFIPYLFGQEWNGAISIFQWLGLSGLHQTISNTFGWLFVTQRRTSEYARFGMFSTLTTLAAFAVGLPWGANGVAAAYGISGLLIRLPAIIWVVGKQGPVSARVIVDLSLPYGISAIGATLAWWLFDSVIALPALLHLCMAATVTFGTFVAVLALFPTGRHAFAEVIEIVRSKMG